MEFELAYYNITVQHITLFASTTPQKILFSTILCLYGRIIISVAVLRLFSD